MGGVGIEWSGFAEIRDKPKGSSEYSSETWGNSSVANRIAATQQESSCTALIVQSSE
jgi:hypothetical protein